MPTVLTPEQRRDAIEKLRRFPAELEAALAGLSDEQLLTRYLPGEWTVAQNVHHLADSHLNAYIRTRLLMTEDHPLLKGYDQNQWAELPDAAGLALEHSMSILRGLHARWTTLLDSLSESDFAREGTHTQSGAYTIDDIVKTYANHGAGHIDQIQRTLAAGAG